MAVVVKKGDKFRSVVGDANLLWVVDRQRGKGTWECVVDASEPDYAGRKKVFTEEEIRASIKFERFFEQQFALKEDFWASREAGETLHWHDSFGRYARCVVVEVHSDGEIKKMIKPIALVGSWGPSDLPRWYDSGIYRDGGYMAESIRKEEAFRPHPTSIWESPDFARPNGPAADIDPTVLEPIDLSKPEPTEKQREAAELLEQINEIRSALKMEGTIGDYPSAYRRILGEIKDIAAKALGTEDEKIPSVLFTVSGGVGEIMAVDGTVKVFHVDLDREGEVLTDEQIDAILSPETLTGTPDEFSAEIETCREALEMFKDTPTFGR